MKNFISILYILLCLNLFGQNECGVTSVTPIFVNNSKATFTSFTFKVYYHIIRKNNGNDPSVSLSEVTNAHQILNSNYLSSNVCFVFSGVDFIDNTDFYNYKLNDEADLFGTNTHSDGIDIYIIRDRGKKSPYNGTSNAVPGNKIIVLNSKVQESTLTHEMGHILGLYHTFEASICVEAEDGSNSSTCGDLVEDTPAQAESCAFLTSSCQYPCSVSYNVTAILNNFLTYSENLSCRSAFTQGQVDRIHDMINDPTYGADLRQRLVPFDRTIGYQNIPYNPFPGIYINDVVQEAKGTLTVQDVNIQSPGKGAFRAEDEVILLPGFDALEGCRALVIIENICKANETQAKQAESLVEYYENEGFRVDLSSEEMDRINQANIESEILQIGLEVYPNPFSENLTISLETVTEYDESSVASIEITDLNGKMVLKSNCSFRLLNEGCKIETSTINSGFYFVKVLVGDESFVSRIVKE